MDILPIIILSIHEHRITFIYVWFNFLYQCHSCQYTGFSVPCWNLFLCILFFLIQSWNCFINFSLSSSFGYRYTTNFHIFIVPCNLTKFNYQYLVESLEFSILISCYLQIVKVYFLPYLDTFIFSCKFLVQNCQFIHVE